jgi:hypothetical protein
VAFKRAIGRQAARPCNGGRGLFSAAGPKPTNALRPPAVQARSARRRVIAERPRWARPTRQRSTTVAIDRDIPDFDDPDASSPTDLVLRELQLLLISLSDSLPALPLSPRNRS